MRPRAGLDSVKKGTICAPVGNVSPDIQAVSPETVVEPLLKLDQPLDTVPSTIAITVNQLKQLCAEVSVLIPQGGAGGAQPVSLHFLLSGSGL
jgi:hypothetical protein